MKTGLFNVQEADVAKRLGLSRETVRQLRVDNLYQDEDFGKVGREICYAEDGIEKLRQVLNRQSPVDRQSPAEKNAGGDCRSPGVTLGDVAGLNVTLGTALDKPTVILDAVVTKIYPHNPQYMEALLGGQPITVRVNNNANFILGMIIQSRQLVMKNQRQFDFIGRCPRARGRW